MNTLSKRFGLKNLVWTIAGLVGLFVTFHFASKPRNASLKENTVLLSPRKFPFDGKTQSEIKRYIDALDAHGLKRMVEEVTLATWRNEKLSRAAKLHLLLSMFYSLDEVHASDFGSDSTSTFTMYVTPPNALFSGQSISPDATSAERKEYEEMVRLNDRRRQVQALLHGISRLKTRLLIFQIIPFCHEAYQNDGEGRAALVADVTDFPGAGVFIELVNIRR